jgi:hypothetical protein
MDPPKNEKELNGPTPWTIPARVVRGDALSKK